MSAIQLKTIKDTRGTLYALNSLPFLVKRVFIVKDVCADRGNHAHKSLWEILIAVSGSCSIHTDDSHNNQVTVLSNPNQGLLLPPLTWRTLKNFSKDCILVSLCSEELDEEDYIRDYKEFKKCIQYKIK